jgi:hypothetical protein
MSTFAKLSALLAATSLAFPMLAAAQSATIRNLPAPPPPAKSTPLPSYTIPRTNVDVALTAPPASNPGTRTVISPGVVTPPSGHNQPPQPSQPAVFVTIPIP